MSRRLPVSRFVTQLALATFLIAAQSAVLAHSFKHDAGAPPAQTCTVCAAAGQLSSATIDHAPAADPALPAGERLDGFASQSIFFQPVSAHQRGPPASV